MKKYKYTVEWEGDLSNYKQDFDTLEEARIALALHSKRNSRLLISIQER
jgi:hypothetical protein